MHYILESTFASVFLFLELILKQETHIYNDSRQFAQFAHIGFAILSLFHNNFILIGHSKHCVHSRRTRGVLKIERYEQRLTHRACIGEASSYSCAPGITNLKDSDTHFHFPLFASMYCYANQQESAENSVTKIFRN